MSDGSPVKVGEVTAVGMPSQLSSGRIIVNPSRTGAPVDRYPPSRDPLKFHQTLEGYRPSPLLRVPTLARELGLRELWVKYEADRYGLPAFKMLGASWASWCAICHRIGNDPARTAISVVQEQLSRNRLKLVAATDGNHGRAVARMARLLNAASTIYVPAGTAKDRTAAIESEGAQVVIVDGDYDLAVKRAAEREDGCHVVVSDTGSDETDQAPRWVIDGYSTMFWEIDDSLSRSGYAQPDVVVVPIGVGALAAAAVNHYARVVKPPTIIGVEPTSAACVAASLQAGQPVAVRGPHESIMAGLNCGEPSRSAWPLVASGVDAVVVIDDVVAIRAMRRLACSGISAGETGAAALGGLIVAVQQGFPMGPALGDSKVLVLVTEGPTDWSSWWDAFDIHLLG